MDIPDKAVEVAARAEEDALYPGAWDELSDMGQKLRMDRLRPILEAAAPFIAARALQDVAEEWAGEPAVEWTAGDVVYALRFRIKQIESQ